MNNLLSFLELLTGLSFVVIVIAFIVSVVRLVIYSFATYIEKRINSRINF